MRTILNKGQQQNWIRGNWMLSELHIDVTKSGTVHLFDSRDNLLSKAGGYGYDKVGTVFSDFIKQHFTEELLKLAKSKYCSKFYGLSLSEDKKEVYLNGACGGNCMIEILNAIGFNVRSLRNGTVFLISSITGSKTYSEQRIRGLKK